MNFKDLKKFLRYYNRYLLSILPGLKTEETQAIIETVLEDVITDEDLQFLYNLYQEIEFQKPINKTLNKKKGIIL